MLAKVKEYHTTSYPEEPSWYSVLLEQASKGNYLDEQLQATMGEYYEPFKFVKNINRHSAIQARLPYYLQIH